MAQSTGSKESQKAKAWLKPQQVTAMENAVVKESKPILQQRDKCLIKFLYDTGLRVGECVQVDGEMLDIDDGVLRLPADIQKEYPTEHSSPSFTRIGLDDNTQSLLYQYVSNRWKDTVALFPSTHSDRMTCQAVRNVVGKAAEAAGVEPYTTKGRGGPKDVSPHTLRHSVAYRMLEVKDGHDIYDVKNRLRHERLQTTEQVYSHMEVV